MSEAHLSIACTFTGHGSARCSVTVGSTRQELRASYLSDALGDLVRAAAAMLKGADVVRCAFLEEPGEFRWVLSRKPGRRVALRILAFSDDGLPEDRGKVILSGEFSASAFASAVYVALAGLQSRHGEEGYRQTWGHRFPLDAMRELQLSLGGAAQQAG